jgi:hypothetical protein
MKMASSEISSASSNLKPAAGRGDLGGIGNSAENVADFAVTAVYHRLYPTERTLTAISKSLADQFDALQMRIFSHYTIRKNLCTVNCLSEGQRGDSA